MFARSSASSSHGTRRYWGGSDRARSWRRENRSASQKRRQPWLTFSISLIPERTRPPLRRPVGPGAAFLSREIEEKGWAARRPATMGGPCEDRAGAQGVRSRQLLNAPASKTVTWLVESFRNRLRNEGPRTVSGVGDKPLHPPAALGVEEALDPVWLVDSEIPSGACAVRVLPVGRDRDDRCGRVIKNRPSGVTEASASHFHDPGLASVAR